MSIFKNNNYIYIIRYITILLIYHYIRYIGIPSIFSIHPLIIPIANYLALKFGIFHKLEDDKYTSKKDLFYPFLIFSTIFNIFFFFYYEYELLPIVTIVISNIVEFILIKSKKEEIDKMTKQAIEDYYKNKKE